MDWFILKNCAILDLPQQDNSKLTFYTNIWCGEWKYTVEYYLPHHNLRKINILVDSEIFHSSEILQLIWNDEALDFAMKSSVENSSSSQESIQPEAMAKHSCLYK